MEGKALDGGTQPYATRSHLCPGYLRAAEPVQLPLPSGGKELILPARLDSPLRLLDQKGSTGRSTFCFVVRTHSSAICYPPQAAALGSRFAEGQARGDPAAASSFCPASAGRSTAPGFAEVVAVLPGCS